MVDFKLVVALALEMDGDYPIQDVISHLAMCDIPMTDAVIRLGVASGILCDDYRNNWSEDAEEGDS